LVTDPAMPAIRATEDVDRMASPEVRQQKLKTRNK